MGATPFRLASLVLMVASMAGAEPLRDAPIVWHDDDRRDIPEPAEREPNLLWDQVESSFTGPVSRWTRPSRWVRRAGVPFGGDHVPHAPNVNALDEVPNSSWFTNRIGLFPMTPEEVGNGPGDGSGGAALPWTIIGAKTQGVTPGFTVRDANGAMFLIKFDPPEYPGMASSAGVISARLFHAAGYFVPDDNIVWFRRDDLVLGGDVSIKLRDGSRRPMTNQDIDDILASVRSEDGRWRAISSRFLSGKPIGPFNYEGRRKDDPNDRIDHQHRRELRGLYVFVSWLAHFDTKQHNSLDMYVEDNGRSYVRHHLIDFASTLGTGAHGPTQRWGYEYTVDLMPFFGRIAALGIHDDAWRQAKRPDGLAEIGTYVDDPFDPREYKPLIPNPAFANLTTADAYWAAKIISAFTREHFEAAVAEGQYEDPRASAYMVDMLEARQHKVVRRWFEEIAPLEYFRLDGDTVHFTDLAAERGFTDGPSRYRVQVAAMTTDRDAAGWGAWVDSDETEATFLAPRASADEYPFLAVRAAVDRGDGWSDPVTATFSRRTGRIVEMSR